MIPLYPDRPAVRPPMATILVLALNLLVFVRRQQRIGNWSEDPCGQRL